MGTVFRHRSVWIVAQVVQLVRGSHELSADSWKVCMCACVCVLINRTAFWFVLWLPSSDCQSHSSFYLFSTSNTLSNSPSVGTAHAVILNVWFNININSIFQGEQYTVVCSVVKWGTSFASELIASAKEVMCPPASSGLVGWFVSRIRRRSLNRFWRTLECEPCQYLQMYYTNLNLSGIFIWW